MHACIAPRLARVCQAQVLEKSIIPECTRMTCKWTLACADLDKDACTMVTHYIDIHLEMPVELSVSLSDACGKSICNKGSNMIGHRANRFEP